MHENPNLNLPDGCSVNDIPGNRPEDIAREKYVERYFFDPEYIAVYILECASHELSDLTARRVEFIVAMSMIDPKHIDIIAHGLGENYILWLEDMWEEDDGYVRP